MAKRHNVYSYLRLRDIHIAYLQETHLNSEEAGRLKRRWRGQVFATTCSAYAKGVLIWIKPGVPFVVKKTWLDEDGRYVLVTGRLAGREVTLGCVPPPIRTRLDF